MRHITNPRFWKCYDNLPLEVRELADKNYQLLKSDRHHTSLELKKVRQFWSVRVGLHYRALGVDATDGILWVWIGSHAEYDHLIR